MHFTKVQISEFMRKHAEKENSLHDLMGIMLESMMVADSIKGLDVVVGEKFPSTPLQRCVTHLKRKMFAKVSHGDNGTLAADLRDIFRTGQRDYTIETAWEKWQEMCEKWGKSMFHRLLL